MFRSWIIWLAFGGCLAAVIAAVGWLSFKALEADNAEAVAGRQAALEDVGRLALWRMDSAVAPLIAQESSRPFSAYKPFQAIERSAADSGKGKGSREEAVPSPILIELPSVVRLHFQIGPDGRFSSPRVLAPPLRERGVPHSMRSTDAQWAEALLARVQSLVKPAELLASLPPPETPATGKNALASANATTQRPPLQQSLSPDLQIRQDENEFQARSQFLAQNAQNNSPFRAVTSPGANAAAQTGMMKPIWVGGELLLARRARFNGQEYVQGCLLDWPAIEAELLDSVRDLLPSARLMPYSGWTPSEPAELLVPPPVPPGAIFVRIHTGAPPDVPDHMLASLPVQLELGSLRDSSPDAAMSPVRMSLIVAWGAMALAALAVAALLRGVLSLSERRATFVSAVTHELRTPLTTFRMYAEMLADDMVPDEANRRHYLQTLRVEADRLTHLVENVLSYARLERGRPGGQTAPLSISQILDPAADRLGDRARQGGFELIIERDDATRDCRVLADPAAVEQILFNLVDNACKYAATATDRTLQLTPQACDGQVWLRLRDRGPGVSADQRRVLFQPFRKSARVAATSAPGVGLGLALCRRLARDMGGDLDYEPDPMGGACFALRLRSAPGQILASAGEQKG